jgi:nickel-dependent lactate racemase
LKSSQCLRISGLPELFPARKPRKIIKYTVPRIPNFKVDCLINRRGEIASLYAGSFRATHSLGAQEGKKHYGIPFSGGYDIAVSNAYGKASESGIALFLAMMALKPGAAGTGVVIVGTAEGQVPHYVFRSWGSDYGGRHYKLRPKGMIASFMKKLIVLNPHPSPTCLDLFGHVEDVMVVKSWQEVLAILERDYPGAARICVIQDGTVQYIMKPEV